jgi:hypothetical protein
MFHFQNTKIGLNTIRATFVKLSFYFGFEISSLLHVIVHLNFHLYRAFPVKRNPNYYTWTPSRRNRRNKWLYWILAALSRYFSWCTASYRYGRNFSCSVARWALCHRQTLPVSRNFATSLCIVLFSTSLSGYALLNASRTAANDFDAKWCSRVNTRCAREYTMFTPAQLLRNWREQRPSNQDDLDSSVSVEVGRVHYTGVGILVISFLYRSTRLLLGWVLNGTPCWLDILHPGYLKLYTYH